MIIEIEFNGNQSDAIQVELALNNLAKNLNKENLLFISELSKKPKINDKLAKKKDTILKYL